MTLPVAILAGGLASRLRPITEKIPKAMVETAGRPFIFHQLDWLRNEGVRQVVLCLGYLGERVQGAVGDGGKFGLAVTYSFDGDPLLGTGGALKKALPKLGKAFFVLYGDSYLRCRFAEVEAAFLAAGKPALMTVMKNDGRWDRSNALFGEGHLVRFDKEHPTPDMHHIDYGLSIVRSEVFALYRENQILDLAEVFATLSAQNELAGFVVSERFYEIGSPQGLKETQEFLSARGSTVAYAKQHLEEAVEIIRKIDVNAVERVADLLAAVKRNQGRLFFLGVGGSAANCSHAVNDFRKIVGIESYAPTDNVSELTARTNDEGWSTVFVEWLKTSRIKKEDCVFIFSVGGGNLEKNISPNLVEALKYAKQVGAKVTGVVGRDGGYTAKVADACVIVPTVNSETVTPHSEAFQAVIWHLLVSHPKLKANQTKWESAVKS